MVLIGRCLAKNEPMAAGLETYLVKGAREPGAVFEGKRMLVPDNSEDAHSCCPQTVAKVAFDRGDGVDDVPEGGRPVIASDRCECRGHVGLLGARQIDARDQTIDFRVKVGRSQDFSRLIGTPTVDEKRTEGAPGADVTSIADQRLT